MPAAARSRRTGATSISSLTLFLISGLLAGIGYALSFTGEFQFDDYQFIGNPAFDEPSPSTFLRWSGARVLPYATLLLNRELGGEVPLGFHVFNFLVHLAATFWVIQLAREICRTPRMRHGAVARHETAFALAAGILFAIHPIQVQAVTYIIQRMSSMATLFYVGSVLYYVRARNIESATGPARTEFLLSVGLATAAFLCKESAASLPLAIALAEVAFFGRRELGRSLRRVIPCVFVLLVLVVVRVLGTADPGEMGSVRSGGLLDAVRNMLARPAERSGILPHEYFLTQLTVLPRYLGMVILPRGFNIDHDIAVQTALSLPVVLGGALLVLLFAFGLYAVRPWPALGFGVLWFFVASSVESSIVPIRDLMNEHRMYLAMPGIALGLAVPFTWMTEKNRRVAALVGVCIAAGLTACTYARNEVWRTQGSLWADAVRKSPGKARAHANFATAVHLEGDLDLAVQHYCRALQIDPSNRNVQAKLSLVQSERVEAGSEPMVAQQGPDGSIVLVPRNPCVGLREEGEKKGRAE